MGGFMKVLMITSKLLCFVFSSHRLNLIIMNRIIDIDEGSFESYKSGKSINMGSLYGKTSNEVFTNTNEGNTYFGNKNLFVVNNFVKDPLKVSNHLRVINEKNKNNFKSNLGNFTNPKTDNTGNMTKSIIGNSI